MNAEGAIVTEAKAIERMMPSKDLSDTFADAARLAHYPDCILGSDHREALDFEPIVLPPGSPNVAELIINDRGER